jgi:hypothetical protein
VPEPEKQEIPLDPTPRIDLLEFYEAYGPGVLVRLPTGDVVTCKPLTARQVAELMPAWVRLMRPRKVEHVKIRDEHGERVEDRVIPDTGEESLDRLAARTELHQKVAEYTKCDALLDLLPEEYSDLISFFFYLSRPRSAKSSSANGGGEPGAKMGAAQTGRPTESAAAGS